MNVLTGRLQLDVDHDFVVCQLGKFLSTGEMEGVEETACGTKLENGRHIGETEGPEEELRGQVTDG